MFDHILQNESTKLYLSNALKKKTLSHTLLFTGPPQSEKVLFAKAVAAHRLQTKTLETHPDFHEIFPESKQAMHTIDSLRKLIDETHIASYHSHGKVFIIHDAERMQPAAANALLKTLEEPSDDTTLILLAESSREMLPTILSRCTQIALKGTSREVTHDPVVDACLNLLRNRPSYPQKLLEIEKLEKLIESESPIEKSQNVEKVFSTVMMWHRDQAARKEGVEKELLFFPEETHVPPAATLSQILKRIEEAHLAYTRNIRFATCIERIFF
jgi:DNA polymerase III delta prime subunit